MAEGSIARAQHPLAQHAAMGMHEREGGVVADGADIAEMIGETLQFGHQRPQPDRARRNLDAERGFDRAGKGKRIGDGAVAGRPAGKLAARSMVGAGHQALDALVDVAETLLQPDNGFAACRESKMARLDDAGMHRPDRDLMQALAFRGKEPVGQPPPAAAAATAKRMAARPNGRDRATGGVSGSPCRLQPEQVRGPRARGAMPADACRPTDGKAAVRAFQADDADVPDVLIEKRHVDRVRLAPETEQAPAAVGKLLDGKVPGLRRHHGARPGRMVLDTTAGLDQVNQRGHAFCSSASSKNARRHAGTRRPAAPADRCRRQTPAPDGEYIGT